MNAPQPKPLPLRVEAKSLRPAPVIRCEFCGAVLDQEPGDPNRYCGQECSMAAEGRL